MHERRLKFPGHPAKGAESREDSREIEVQKNFTLKWGDLVFRINHSVNQTVVNCRSAIFSELFANNWERRQRGRNQHPSPLRMIAPSPRFQKETEKLGCASINLEHLRYFYLFCEYIPHRRILQ